MNKLNPYFVKKSLEQIQLSDAIRRHTDELLNLAANDHRINVIRIHESLFPLNTRASANASLNRLLKTINDAAAHADISLRAHITKDKKAGPANRWVWFEGALPDPGPAHTSALNAIAPELLIEDQQGLIINLPVVVFITCNDHESTAVLQTFYPVGRPQSHTPKGITYNILGLHGNMQIYHCVSRQSICQAQNTSRDIIEDLHPAAIIAVGIAFGVNPEKQRIGDVLISENVQDYELSRINQDGSITPRGHKPEASSMLIQRFNHVNQTANSYPESSLTWPKLHFGTILSGAKLVDNLNYRQSLQKLAPEAIGGEMEAFGIYMAANHRDKTDWIIIKAICDWANGNKNANSKEKNQKLAAENAALVVKKALDLGSLFKPGHKQNFPGTDRPDYPQKDRIDDLAKIRAYSKDLDSIPNNRRIKDIMGQPVRLEKDIQEHDIKADKGVKVMHTLLEWLKQDKPPHLFALLGEYGMGKTITCQLLDKNLREKRKADFSLPLPLFFDLRHVTGLDKRVPTLAQTLEECMARGWPSIEGEGNFTLEDIYKWTEQGAVIIIDGLDEVLVKLKESDGQVFTANLLKIQADIKERCKAKGLKPAPLKLLISCRTQYFRTLRDQNNHFTGQERSEYQAEAFSAMLLLLLNEEQIKHYLTQALPETAPERLMETIRSVHNLEDLSRRPYTLKLVSEFIPEIEKNRMAGKTVYGVSLYRHMAKRWLERDQGKHHIKAEHKMLLAAHLAAWIWNQGQGLLPAGQIEDWFHTWLDSQTHLRARYSRLHPDQLEEDLRTATFLGRHDNEKGSNFKFAHTSLMEFFLADYLITAAKENKSENWAINKPSKETLDFMGQMLAESQSAEVLQNMQNWLNIYRPKINELILSYTLHAYDKGWPYPSLRGLDMTGFDLSELVFQGKGSQELLDLSHANFRHSNLRRSIFEHVNLHNATFEGSALTQANFLHCEAKGVNWSNSDCTAVIWRYCNLENCKWQDCIWQKKETYITQEKHQDPASLSDILRDYETYLPTYLSPLFIFCEHVPDTDSGVDCTKICIAPAKDSAIKEHLELVFNPHSIGFELPQHCNFIASNARSINTRGGQFIEHSNPINCCTWSPDGNFIASGVKKFP